MSDFCAPSGPSLLKRACSGLKLDEKRKSRITTKQAARSTIVRMVETVLVGAGTLRFGLEFRAKFKQRIVSFRTMECQGQGWMSTAHSRSWQRRNDWSRLTRRGAAAANLVGRPIHQWKLLVSSIWTMS